MRMLKLLGVLVTAAMCFACGDDVACGEGTELSNGECVVSDAGVGGELDARIPEIDANVRDATVVDPMTCGEGTHAENGECVPNPTKRPVGAACNTGDDCQTGTCAPPANNLPGGYCTVLGCSMERPCPTGSTCYRLNNSLSLCMAYCDRNTECRTDENYHCQPLYSTSLNICAPSCELSESCSAGTRCNPESGLCELAECDVASPGDACNDQETCWADSEGLSSKGGLCLDLCDTADPDETCLTDRSEVCQPFANDPSKGFCAPPVCTKTSECPAGAECKDSVCQPPALCDGSTACADDKTCVSGKCLPKCPTGDTECSDLHPDFVCATVLSTPACLPLGSFPGSACRPGATDRCDNVTVGASSTPMVCQDDVCLADCTTGGDALCTGLSSTLQCARDIFDTDLCLPKGSFPGSECGGGNTCAQDLEGDPAIDMTCSAGTCVVMCSEDDKWAGYGDALCSLVDSSLTCSTSAGSICVRGCGENGSCATGYSCLDAGEVPDHENACLPDGSFPGSACRPISGDACDSDVGGDADVDMVCVNDVCVVSCPDDDDDLCTGVSASLTCSETAGDLCVLGCVSGACPTGYSCLSPGGENACLPTGSFPSSPCRETVGNECDQNLGGVDAVDMVCAEGQCLISCAPNLDLLCSTVNPALTCSESAGNYCVVGCASGNCLPGFSCLDPGSENACLPTGSFPGSPCRETVGDECDQNVGGNEDIDMECVSDICTVSCPSNDDDLCETVDSALTCSETAGDVCTYACSGGTCPTGYSCLDPGTEAACLPNGTFPGSACRPGNECDQNLNGVAWLDMECSGGTCFLECPSDNSEICDFVDDYLTCYGPLNLCVLECDEGECPAGFVCDTGENACLPD